MTLMLCLSVVLALSSAQPALAADAVPSPGAVVDDARRQLAAMAALIDDADRASVRAELHNKATQLDRLLAGLVQAQAPAGGLSVTTDDGTFMASGGDGSGGVSVYAGPSGLSINITTTEGVDVGAMDVREVAPVAPVAVSDAPVACGKADFMAVAAAVDSESFSDGKLARLRSAAADRWFSADQATQLIELFDFGSDKVQAGQVLFPRVVDPKNWYRVYDAFDFDSDRDALRKAVGR